MPDDTVAEASADDATTTTVSAGDSTPQTSDATDRENDEPADETRRRVVVPERVYKTITVFSTLFAVVSVVVGFVFLDSATDRARAPLSEVDPLLALLGLGLIVFGAVSYAFSTRFETDGMGNAKEDTDEPSNNG